MKFDRYETLEELHAGTKTVVWRARRKADDKPVVIKSFRREFLSPRERARLHYEFSTLSELGAARCVAKPIEMLDLGAHAALVLDDIGGASLRSYAAVALLDLEEALYVGCQVAVALADVHRANAIHKNIQPHNIVLNRASKQVELIDFAISTRLGREKRNIENVRQLERTLTHISPEQTGRMNRALDYRTDFYSLGATLYEVLTGVPPFPVSDPARLVHAILTARPAPPHTVTSRVPEAVSRVVLKLMEKEPEARYQSAHGVHADLARCLKELRGTKAIRAFAVGAEDRVERFEISQKLYGREREIGLVLEAYESVTRGARRFLLVEGEPGAGKSMLVNEVQKPMVQHGALFAAGKFDQFRRNIPYSALLQALAGIIFELIKEDEHTLALWKKRVASAVESNGRVITDILPAASHLLGETPELPSLGVIESRNRFGSTLQAFVQAFISSERPLVLFLDDLQWADLGTLDLLGELMSNQNSAGLLLLGAYRSNEVDASHPLSDLRERLRKKGIPNAVICVGNLNPDGVATLISDSMRCTIDAATSLAALVYEKTTGNPFFLNEFLMDLYRRGLVEYDVQAGSWVWDMERTRNAHVTRNVAALLAEKIDKLPPASKAVLKIAACLGGTFDLGDLAVAGKEERGEVARLLWPSLQLGLVIPLSRDYQYAGDIATDEASETLAVTYKFAHDHVRDAAYSLFTEAERAEAHGAIGQLLLARLTSEQLYDALFDVVDHLNKGVSVLGSKEERRRLTELNLLAAQQAKTSGAYDTAMSLLGKAAGLLPSDSWETDYTLRRDISKEVCNVEFARGGYDAAMQGLRELLPNLRTPLEQADIYQLFVALLTSLGRYEDAYQHGLTALALLGSPVTIDPPEAQLAESEERITRALMHALQSRSVEDLLRESEVVDPIRRAEMSLLAVMVTATNHSSSKQPALFRVSTVRGAELVLLHGKSRYSAALLMNYITNFGFIIRRDPQSSALVKPLSLLVLAMVERTPDVVSPACAIYGMVKYGLYGHVPATEIIQIVKTWSVRGVEYGDPQGVSFLVIFQGWLLARHATLSEAVEELERWAEFVRHRAGPIMWFRFSALKAMSHRLLRRNHAQERRVVAAAHAAPLETADAPTETSRRWHLSIEFLVTFIHRDFERYIHDPVAMDELVEFILSSSFELMNATSAVFCGLTIGALAQERPPSQREKALDTIRRLRDELLLQAGVCPAHHHDVLLLNAEIERLSGDSLRALRLFQASIDGFLADGSLPFLATALECAGRLCHEGGLTALAHDYLSRARATFDAWGAVGKVGMLTGEFAVYFGAEGTRGAPNAARPEAVAPAMSADAGLSISSSDLDFSAVIRACQSLSSEVVVEELLRKLMNTILENAGADRGVLLLCENGEFHVEAEARTGDERGSPGEAVGGRATLPKRVIEFVARTMEPLVIGDGSERTTFPTEDYFRNHLPLSILCAPIKNQGEIAGVVYLENHATRHAFTSERVLVVSIISAQAVISLENARVYENLEKKVALRTSELEAAQERVLRLEKHALEAQLAGGFAHEMRNCLSSTLTCLASLERADSEQTRGTVVEENAAALKDAFHMAIRHLPPEMSSPFKTKFGTVVRNEKLLDNVLRLISSATGQALRVTDRIMKYASLGRDTPGRSEMELGDVLSTEVKCLERWGKQQGVVIRARVEAAPVLGKAAHWQLLFDQLVQNAKDASGDGGVSGERQIDIYIGALGGRTVLRVGDNGQGMSEAVQKRIFEPFFSTRPETGTGLGMGMVQKVAELYGAELTVESQEGKGTVVTLLSSQEWRAQGQRPPKDKELRPRGEVESLPPAAM